MRRRFLLQLPDGEAFLSDQRTLIDYVSLEELRSEVPAPK